MVAAKSFKEHPETHIIETGSNLNLLKSAVVSLIVLIVIKYYNTKVQGSFIMVCNVCYRSKKLSKLITSIIQLNKRAPYLPAHTNHLFYYEYIYFRTSL